MINEREDQLDCLLFRIRKISIGCLCSVNKCPQFKVQLWPYKCEAILMSHFFEIGRWFENRTVSVRTSYHGVREVCTDLSEKIGSVLWLAGSEESWVVWVETEYHVTHRYSVVLSTMLRAGTMWNVEGRLLLTEIENGKNWVGESILFISE